MLNEFGKTDFWRENFERDFLIGYYRLCPPTIFLKEL